MSAPDGSSSNAAEQRDSEGLSVTKGVMERGLGRDLNITVIAALLSLIVALSTSVVTSRIAAGNALKEARRDREREAIIRLQLALLRETDTTIAVVAEGLPAEFTVVQGVEPITTDPVSDRVIAYLSAQRECDAARDAVADANIKAASREVSDLNARVARARSLEEAERYDSELRKASQKAIKLMNETLRKL
jgi:hypothetical protein